MYSLLTHLPDIIYIIIAALDHVFTSFFFIFYYVPTAFNGDDKFKFHSRR